MTILAFIAGLLAGGFTVGWAARYRIRNAEARAELRGLTTRHVIESAAGMVP